MTNLLKIERLVTSVLAVGIVALLALQLTSLFIVPIHDTFLWWGDESWLMQEYKEQFSSGVLRHPYALGSTLYFGNPFPFTAMWLSTLLYGGAATIASSSNYVDVGRTVTAILAIVLLATMYLHGKRQSTLSVLTAVALLVATRSFLLTSHSARYDLLTALSVFAILLLVAKVNEPRWIHLFAIGAISAGGLLVSVHVPIILLLPVAFWASRHSLNPLRSAPLVLGALLTVGLLYGIHLVTQPDLSGMVDITHKVGTEPFFHPFSWSVQSYNLAQKFNIVQRIALPAFAMLGAVMAAIVYLRKAPVTRDSMIFWSLPFVGWIVFESAAHIGYVIYVLPALAYAFALASAQFPLRIQLLFSLVAFVALVHGVQDSITAKANGAVLSSQMRGATRQVDKGPRNNIVSMVPAASYLQAWSSQFAGNVYPTLFINVPSTERTAHGVSFEDTTQLIVFNSGLLPGFMLEVIELRKRVTSPSQVLTGQFLDIGRSYFEPLDPRVDTLFVQPTSLRLLLELN